MITIDGELTLAGSMGLEKEDFYSRVSAGILTRAQNAVRGSDEFFEQCWNASNVLDCWGRTEEMRRTCDDIRRMRDRGPHQPDDEPRRAASSTGTDWSVRASVGDTVVDPEEEPGEWGPLGSH